MSIRVKATKTGYFGYRLLHEGDEFEIPDKSCLGSWMEIIPDPKPKPEESKKEKSFDEDFLN